MKIHNSSGKRRCLCFVLSLALLIVCANIGITALLLLHVNVTQPSVGNIYFGSDRTLVDGHLMVPKSLSTSMLRSGRDPLRLVGDAQLSMAAMPVDNEEGSISVIDIDASRGVKVSATNVLFKNSKNEHFFRVGEDSVAMATERLYISGKATSLPSIQTNYIHATDDATISSPTKSLAIDAAGEVELKSFGGSINAYALNNMTISAPHVILHSKVFMPQILHKKDIETAPKAFQVCLCPSGQLYGSANCDINIDQYCPDD